MTDPLLTVDWVIKTFGGLTAIDGAAFDVSAASITGLIGPNGARKTTLFDVVTGVYTQIADGCCFRARRSVASPRRRSHDRASGERSRCHGFSKG
ncbi:ATP-binding cassette domain-containing protein [Halocatena marina]|uniref:ATP-binding cassette domain-containing protein n=1 Tax=Halocatena marina TaxID=2934937 RepID=A0ABD5YKB9_9EURY